jgi:hypothetical protein
VRNRECSCRCEYQLWNHLANIKSIIEAKTEFTKVTGKVMVAHLMIRAMYCTFLTLPSMVYISIISDDTYIVCFWPILYFCHD